jgi:hypothetical protein
MWQNVTRRTKPGFRKYDVLDVVPLHIPRECHPVIQGDPNVCRLRGNHAITSPAGSRPVTWNEFPYPQTGSIASNKRPLLGFTVRKPDYSHWNARPVVLALLVTNVDVVMKAEVSLVLKQRSVIWNDPGAWTTCNAWRLSPDPVVRHLLARLARTPTLWGLPLKRMWLVCTSDVHPPPKQFFTNFPSLYCFPLSCYITIAYLHFLQWLDT